MNGKLDIKTIRKQKGLTQSEASGITGIPLRTFKNYENDSDKRGSIKYEYIVEKLMNYGIIDEEHGILTEDEIKDACGEVFSEYDVEFAILFGSYARGMATDQSDVDILVSTEAKGLKFYGLTEKLRESLKKRVDILNIEQVESNPELLYEILKDGKRLYSKK